jgi:hypothetical protein
MKLSLNESIWKPTPPIEAGVSSPVACLLSILPPELSVAPPVMPTPPTREVIEMDTFAIVFPPSSFRRTSPPKMNYLLLFSNNI